MKDKTVKYKYIRDCPWYRYLHTARSRCNSKNNCSYKYYGAKGIKCLLSYDDLKKLWFRDKAYLMKKPSIDREDNKKNYTFDNCQFLEFSKNSSKGREKPVYQYSVSGIFIKEWKSQRFASRKLKIDEGNIGKCVKNVRKTAGGYKWYPKTFMII